MIFDTTMGGVKFVRGRKAMPLGPGIHFYWPATTTLDTYPTARQCDDLRSQTVVTADDKVIVVSGQIVYEVTDVMLLLPRVFRPMQAIQDMTVTAIHDVVCQLTWDELKMAQRKGTLDTKLRNAAKDNLSDYGVRVLKVQLTDLAPARVIKLMTSEMNYLHATPTI